MIENRDVFTSRAFCQLTIYPGDFLSCTHQSRSTLQQSSNWLYFLWEFMQEISEKKTVGCLFALTFLIVAIYGGF